MSGLKAELHQSLRATRQEPLSRLEGLGEYDLRRPMTPTGTNLPGLVKHLTGLEMWARPDESSQSIIGRYEQACAHADQTIAELELDAPGSVAHWDQDERQTTLGAVVILMVWETAQHAGHADTTRELIDGTAGADHDQILTDPGWQLTSPGSRPRRTPSSPAPHVAGDGLRPVRAGSGLALGF